MQEDVKTSDGWSVVDAETPTSLNGVKVRYTIVADGYDVVAYAFDADKANLMAAATEMLTDLQVAANTLRHYETMHLVKAAAGSTKEAIKSLKKAKVNAALAARFEATIAKATGAAS